MAQTDPTVAAQAGNKYYGATGWRSVKAFFANYVNFRGRSSRREYWWFILISAIFSSIAGIASFAFIMIAIFGNVDKLTTGMDSHQFWPLLGGSAGIVIFWIVLYLAILLPSIALVIRRFRDAGVHWAVFVLIVIVEVITGVIFYKQENTFELVSNLIMLIPLVICVLPSKNRPVALTEQ